ncbi:MAG TPA: hypothetical protein VMT62_06615 [Syntrophorhabdaceae bacterium]|nr:hypothetical protein [Syntrophorhabdaceae bacterium]
MSEAIVKHKHTLLLPFFMGGLIGGGIALILAPQLMKARGAILAGVDKAKDLLAKKNGQPSPEGTYCAVPEGADICFDEKKST